jgi:tRNA(Ile)-lysidine synthase TilS/MesJ
MNECTQRLERDIIKKYRKELWSRFIQGIKAYDLVEEGDCIAVAVSGGKDSLLMAKLFQELHRHPLVPFSLRFIAMDPGFHPDNRARLEENASILGIELEIEQSDVFRVAGNIASDYPCYLCARMRRGFLYDMAQRRGCNKLALGHHFDDIIETTMMSILYSGMVRTMVPKLSADHFDNMELIRPMNRIREADISRLMSKHGIETMDCGCEIHACSVSSKRQRVKSLIQQLSKENPDIPMNLFRAMENVDREGIISFLGESPISQK